MSNERRLSKPPPRHPNKPPFPLNLIVPGNTNVIYETDESWHRGETPFMANDRHGKTYAWRYDATTYERPWRPWRKNKIVRKSLALPPDLRDKPPQKPPRPPTPGEWHVAFDPETNKPFHLDEKPYQGKQMTFRTLPPLSPPSKPATSSQPPLPSSPRTDPNTLWQLLERTHGDVPEVRLVRASWLLGPALASKSSLSTWERFPSRNTLERLHPEAFLPTAELRKLAGKIREGAKPAKLELLPIVAVSHDWATLDHPDPRADRLVALATALELHQLAGADGTAPLPSEVGVYIPWCSLCQEDMRGGRTQLQREAFASALLTMPLWYTHRLSTVLLIHPPPPPPNPPPTGPAAAVAAKRGAAAKLTSTVSSLIQKGGSGGAADFKKPHVAQWNAPHGMWAIGGHWPSLERTVLLLCGKRPHGTGGKGWAQLIEVRLGEGGDGLSGELSASVYASTAIATDLVRELHDAGQTSATEWLRGGGTNSQKAMLSWRPAALDTSVVGTLLPQEGLPFEPAGRGVPGGRQPLAAIQLAPVELVDKHGKERRVEGVGTAAQKKAEPPPSTPLPPPKRKGDVKSTSDYQVSFDSPENAAASKDVATEFGLQLEENNGFGVRIVSVDKGGRGDKAGVKANSVILALGDDDVRNVNKAGVINRLNDAPRPLKLTLNKLVESTFQNALYYDKLGEHTEPPARHSYAQTMIHRQQDRETVWTVFLEETLDFFDGLQALMLESASAAGRPASFAAASSSTAHSVATDRRVSAKKYGWSDEELTVLMVMLPSLTRRHFGKVDGGLRVELGKLPGSSAGGGVVHDEPSEFPPVEAMGAYPISKPSKWRWALRRLKKVKKAVAPAAYGGEVSRWPPGVVGYSVETLQLGANAIGNAGVEAIANCAMGSGALSSLTHLSLNDNKVRDDGMASLSKALCCPHALPRLDELNLSINRIGDSGLIALAKECVRGSMRHLTTLRVDSNRVADDGARALSRAFGRGAMAGLLTLDLSGNRIGDAGVIAIGKVSRKALLHLRYLDLSDNVLGGRNADIYDGGGDPGVLALAEALEAGHFNALIALRLNANRVGDAGAAALANAGSQGGGKALRDLRLENNSITVTGVKALAAAIGDSKALPSLAILGLNGNPGLEEGMSALSSAVGIGPRALLSLGDRMIDGREAGKLSIPPPTSWAAAGKQIQRDARM